MMFSNKKAEGEGTLRRILINIVLIAIIVFLLWRFIVVEFVQKSVQECPAGWCADACDFSKEIREGTKVCAANEKQVCCKPLNPNTNPLSSECKDKKEGDYCGGTYRNGGNVPKVCTAELKCEELCVWCASHSSDPKCTFTPDKVIGEKITSFNGGFSCNCKISECTSSSKFSCIKGFCSTLDQSSSNYYCCNK